MGEKRYLKWYNKLGYGSGDLAGNMVYAFLSSFVMLYLTNTVGLNPGIIGTLIMVSKLFDGVSDIFFGTMIDKTKSKLGKARPWMLYAYIGCAVTLVANFAIPASLGRTAQYAWFFIAYTMLNAVFFTANNIAYASLVTFCTRNSKERVEMGSFRFIFAFSTSLIIQSVTVQFVRALGNGASAWKTVAIIYAVIGLIVNTISVFSIKELPEEELAKDKDKEEKYSLIEAAKLLVSNKYYLMICGTYVCQQIYSAMLNMGIYYMIYILKNEDLYSIFSWAINIPVIIAMCITPMLVERMKGLYRMNLAGYILGTAGRVGVIIAGYMGSVPLMIAFTAVAALGMAPWQGDMGAVVASCSEYTWLTKGKHIDGTMYSCTSFGTKIGGGIGVALCGWLLDISGFVKTSAVQPTSCINMLHVMYLWIPMLLSLCITFIMSRMNVEGANEKLRAQMESAE
jgi:GPH family glycoside/pentoside/hexuronide:cation symporter|nr:glycoside-pentoside-hexuronide (GPH):cation symporter [uncultured Anaerostipes sp.]